MEENNEIIKNDHIIPVKIDEEMKSSYIDYSMSVIVSRALDREPCAAGCARRFQTGSPPCAVRNERAR